MVHNAAAFVVGIGFIQICHGPVPKVIMHLEGSVSATQSSANSISGTILIPPGEKFFCENSSGDHAYIYYEIL